MKNPNKQQQQQRTRIKPATRVLVFSGVVLMISFAIFFIYANLGASKKAQAGLGMLGTKTVSATNVILNEFTTLTANAVAGAVSITVANSSLNTNSRFGSGNNLVAGELVMIIQMQGATLTTTSATSSTWGAVSAYNSAGLYEFDQVASVPNSTTINLVSALKNSYTGSGKVQVVRVPRYTNFTLNSGASLTTDDWNGSTGGIIAFEANGTTTINGTIDVSGKGFRGGAVQNNSTCCSNGANSSTYATATSSVGAEKGEGIGGSATTYDGLTGGRYGRGSAANGGGGGNSHNAAGGGGSNGDNGVAWNGFGNPDTITVSTWKTAWDLDGATTTFHKNTSAGGGRGGYTYSSKNKDALTVAPGASSWNGDDRANVGGLGGRPLSTGGSARLFMGGGGGAGDSNDGLGTSGGDGGGLVYIVSGGAVSGSGTINANGSDVPNSTSTSSNQNGDGSGGGGGGGTVVIYTQGASISNLTINAKGGLGGTQDVLALVEAEGAGGGGGGGYIATTNANSLTRNVSGGKNGTTNSSALTEFLPNGATMGATGATALNPPSPYSGTVSLPVELTSFRAQEKNNAIEISWSTASETNNDFFTLEKSADGLNFKPVTRVRGAGNSVHELNYAFVDKNPFKSDNYYRLSQADFNGQSKIFNQIYIRINSTGEKNILVSAYPMPFNDQLKIDYSLDDAGTVEFAIVNNQGKIVKLTHLEAGEGINSLTFNDFSTLPGGIYMVVMRYEGDRVKTIKVIKI